MDKWEFLRWRRTLGYTEEEAADTLGVARGTINNWERGGTRIPQASNSRAMNSRGAGSSAQSLAP